MVIAANFIKYDQFNFCCNSALQKMSLFSSSQFIVDPIQFNNGVDIAKLVNYASKLTVINCIGVIPVHGSRLCTARV